MDGQPVSRGAGGAIGTRNAPSLLNVSFNKLLFWDGRGASLAINSLDPLFNPVEHALADFEDLRARIATDSALSSSYATAFGRPVSEATIADLGSALAAYLQTIGSQTSAFDRYFLAGNDEALTSAANRGFELFRGRAACASCHIVDETSVSFTDHDFHSVGAGLEGVERRIPKLLSRLQATPKEKIGALILSDYEIAALGRFAITLNPSDVGKFRTPSLRNVAVTAPYMHDGSVPTLEAAIELEASYRGLSSRKPIILTEQDKADLVEFLKSLTADELVRR